MRNPRALWRTRVPLYFVSCVFGVLMPAWGFSCVAFFFAVVVLMIYMCGFYGVIPGLIADGALVLNIFFALGILASFQAVLTLPGIAGMVLTLGIELFSAEHL